MKYETSAGGVIYRIRNNRIEILLIKDKNALWTFPKGIIEKEEDKVETAKREIREETGLINLMLIDNIGSISYFYKLNGELIKKTVYYFLFKYLGGDRYIPQREEGIQDIKWVEEKKIFWIIGYQQTNKKILKKAIKMIDTHGRYE